MSENRSRPAHHNIIRPHAPVVYLITICTKNREQILANAQVHEHVLSAWARLPGQTVGRYVIMPDHLHFFCTPNPEVDSRLGQYIRAFKALVTNQWEDRPITKPWLLDYWDRQMRSRSHYVERLSYVLQNPVRAGLVATPDEWPFAGCVTPLIWD